jgi:hypothetical protein
VLETQQCQDVLLSNQCHQNEKLSIDEFDEFPLSKPPLDEDLFASLTLAELVAMMMLPPPSPMAANTRMMTSDPSQHRALSFPFLVS